MGNKVFFKKLILTLFCFLYFVKASEAIENVRARMKVELHTDIFSNHKSLFEVTFAPNPDKPVTTPEPENTTEHVTSWTEIPTEDSKNTVLVILH